MKRYSYLIGSALCVLGFLCSCESAEIPELDKKSTHRLDIQVSDFDVTYLDIGTRAQAASSRRISFAVLDQDKETVCSIEQVEDSTADFGKITCELASGSYTLIAVVHQSSQPADISHDKVCFRNDSVSDTFLASREIVLSDDAPITDIDMKARRAVSLFRLTCKDELPEDIKSFSILMGKGDNRVNPMTGYCVNDRKHQCWVAVDPSERGRRDFSFSIFTFLGSREVDVDIDVSANSMDGDVIKTVSFKGIKLGINKKTDAHGAFFIQKQAIGISYDDEWAGTEDIDF